MKTLCFAALFLSSMWLHDARAQGTATPQGTPEPPPLPPLLARHLPDFCQWTVDYKYKVAATKEAHDSVMDAYKKLAGQDSSVANAMSNPRFLYALDPPRPLRTAVVKTGNIRYEVQSMERGFQSECWAFGDTVVERAPDSRKLDVHMDDPDPEGEFPELTWLSVSNFKERKKIEGVDCLVFQETVDPLAISNPRGFIAEQKNGQNSKGLQVVKVEVTAVVTDQTRLPVSLQTPTESRRYIFADPPTQMLSAPPEFLAAAKEMKARLEASARPLSPP